MTPLYESILGAVCEGPYTLPPCGKRGEVRFQVAPRGSHGRHAHMGSIVAGMASCHAPALVLRQPGEDPDQLEATAAAMRELGRVLDETKPDALIILGLDHLEAFSLD